MKKFHPETDAEVLKEEIIEVTKIIMTDEAKKNGIGFASNERMTNTIKLVHDALKLKRPVSAAEVFEGKFLPKTPVLPR